MSKQRVTESTNTIMSRVFPSEILNTPMLNVVSKTIDVIKKRLESFDATKTAYAVLFVGSIAFIAQGVYALITIGLALIVAAWSLKKLFEP